MQDEEDRILLVWITLTQTGIVSMNGVEKKYVHKAEGPGLVT